MSSIFAKPVADLDGADLDRLIAEGCAEGVDLAMPAPPQSPPMITADEPDLAALAAIVAMANGHGGLVVLGIDTVGGRAAHRHPRPRCAALAAALRRAARERVDPPIRQLEVHPIPTRDDGQGVIVVGVRRSADAPHRLETTKECYRRRGASSEPMTMREIQELSLGAARAHGEIDGRFETQRKDFYYQLNQRQVATADTVVGIRVTLLPFDPDFHLDRVDLGHPAVTPGFSQFPAHLGDEAIEIRLPLLVRAARPILRGVRFGGDGGLTQVVRADGLVEQRYLYREPAGRPALLLPNWVVGPALNGLLAADRLRRHSDWPDLEFGLEVEISWSRGDLQLGALGGRTSTVVGVLEPNPLFLPRLALRDWRSIDAIAGIILADLWNAAGEPWPDVPCVVTDLEQYR